MRKFIITAMMLFALVALSACNGNGTVEIDDTNSAEISPIPYVGVAHETHGIVFALDLQNTNWLVRPFKLVQTTADLVMENIP